MQRNEYYQLPNGYYRFYGESTLIYSSHLPKCGRLVSITIHNRKSVHRRLELEFNSNTSLRRFFVEFCPAEWKTLKRYTEINSEHEQQIDFNKDVSTLKKGCFRVSMQEMKSSNEADAELCLSYCEVADQSSGVEEKPTFSVNLSHEKNRDIFKELFAAIQRYEPRDLKTIQEISSHFVTVDDLVAVVAREGIDAAFAHAWYAEDLLAKLVNRIITDADGHDNQQYEHARDCVDKFVSIFFSCDAVLKKMAELDVVRYRNTINFSQAAYKEYFLIAHQMRVCEQVVLPALFQSMKLFS